MLTSFLPGQEAGNVDVVLENGFGEFCDDPVAIGQEVASWLNDDAIMAEMSRQATKVGRPHAAGDIVLDIGTTANAWKSLGNRRRMTELSL
jgi:1,2-diacylglycerol 3-beta-galactosyltransferase